MKWRKLRTTCTNQRQVTSAVWNSRSLQSCNVTPHCWGCWRMWRWTNWGPPRPQDGPPCQTSQKLQARTAPWLMRLAELFGAPSLQDDMIRSGLVSTIFTCLNFIIIHKKTSAISWGPVVPIRFSSNCGDVAMPICQAATATLSRSLLLTFQVATFSVPKQQMCTALNLVPTATFNSFYTLLAASLHFSAELGTSGNFPILSNPFQPGSSNVFGQIQQWQQFQRLPGNVQGSTGRGQGEDIPCPGQSKQGQGLKLWSSYQI